MSDTREALPAMKRIDPETRAQLIDMAKDRIEAVWADVPDGVDSLTLASHIVLAQEFLWMQLALGPEWAARVHSLASVPVSTDVTELIDRAKRQAEALVREHGDPEPPEEGVSIADAVWWTIQDLIAALEPLSAAGGFNDPR